jgi:hypothetical protein
MIIQLGLTDRKRKQNAGLGYEIVDKYCGKKKEVFKKKLKLQRSWNSEFVDRVGRKETTPLDWIEHGYRKIHYNYNLKQGSATF